MISVIIVTYNSGGVIGDCLRSLSKLKDKEIIIVDNKSSDQGRAIVRKFKVQSPKLKVRLIKNKKNVGFTKGCNQGASKSVGEYLLFLNPDTKLLSSFPKPKSGNKNIGIVGFKFSNPDGSLQPSIGRFPNIPNVVVDRIPLLRKYYGMQMRDPKQYLIKHKVEWVSGSGFLVKKSVFEEAGGFDEKIFMYGEDIDLCKRVKDLGYMNYYDPSATFSHFDSGKNMKDRNPHKYYSMRKGVLYYFRKNNTTMQGSTLKGLIKIESFVRSLINKFIKRDPSWKKYLKKTISLE